MNLETWIKTATEKLAPKAAVKVREDISMHVETAVNRYQLERHSEVEALELAVKDLGDAKVAARGLEKAYLTNNELEKFTIEKSRATNQIWFGIFTLGFSLWALKQNLDLVQDKSVHVSWFGVFLALMMSVNFLANGFMAKKFALETYTISRIYLTGTLTLLYIPFSFQQYSEAIAIKQKAVELHMSGVGTGSSLLFPIVVGICILWGLFSLQQDYLKWRKMRFL